MVFPYVKLGQELLSKTQKTNTTPLPDKDCVRFYFLTNQGTYFAQENMRNIENKTSDWLKLFEEANEVMNKLILTAEKK